jgi:DeoR family fructose operon transcriptional repressor
MFAQERHNAIKKIIRERKRMNFADLQKRVKVSSATLRRDLSELEQAGDVIRVHGGVLDPAYVRSEISLDERVLRNHPAKKEIAAKASALIPPGSSVYVDAGSTCLEAGKILLGRKDIRLVTHSVALIAAALQGEAEILCIGGELRRVSGALVGGPALGTLSAIRIDYVLMGASGVDEEGCSTTELSEAEIKKTVLTRSRHRMLLADASKWQNASTIRFAPWTAFTDWVTDRKFSAREGRLIRSAGVVLH